MYCVVAVLNIFFMSYNNRQTAPGVSKKYDVKVGVYNTSNLIFKSSIIALQIIVCGRFKEQEILVPDWLIASHMT